MREPSQLAPHSTARTPPESGLPVPDKAGVWFAGRPDSDPYEPARHLSQPHTTHPAALTVLAPNHGECQQQRRKGQRGHMSALCYCHPQRQGFPQLVTGVQTTDHAVHTIIHVELDDVANIVAVYQSSYMARTTLTIEIETASNSVIFSAKMARRLRAV